MSYLNILPVLFGAYALIIAFGVWSSTPKRIRWVPKVFAAGIIGPIIFVFLIQRYAILDVARVSKTSLWVSIPLFILGSISVIPRLQGIAKTGRSLAIVFLLILSQTFSYGLISAINGWQDNSEPSLHTVKILNKRTVSGRKRITRYYAVVESWRAQGHNLSIQIKSREYQNLNPGTDQLTVITKPGRLGFEWLVSYGMPATDKPLSYTDSE